MDFWNEQADKLQNALLANQAALQLHFLRTASPEAMAEVVGDLLPTCANTRASVIATLAGRLAVGT